MFVLLEPSFLCNECFKTSVMIIYVVMWLMGNIMVEGNMLVVIWFGEC